MISHDEAQELHECLGIVIDEELDGIQHALPSGTFDEVFRRLERARELAAVIVADTMPDPADNVSYAPCIEGVIDDGTHKSEFMIPLDTDSSTKYSQWGADNTVLWPRVDLLEALGDAAREWASENLPRDDEEGDNE